MVRRSLILASATVISALTLIVPASPAQARACRVDFYCTTTFYADSTRTTVVGELYEDCNGDRSFWGRRGADPLFIETRC